MPKLTLEERRLQALRQQLHGKPSRAIKPQSLETPTPITNSPRTETTVVLSNDSYLKKDLLKILILSTLAITLQICLYSLEAKHLINLHF